MHHHRTESGWTAAIALLMAVLGPVAHAQVRDTKVVPERPARVFIVAGIDNDCRSLKPVILTVEQAPAQGAVTFRDNQETTIQQSGSGHCRGTRATGTGIYYTAKVGAKGRDRFTINARLGDLVTIRTFDVEIADD